VSGLYQSGDGNARNGHGTGFDGIIDNQNFGGEFQLLAHQPDPAVRRGADQRREQLRELAVQPHPGPEQLHEPRFVAHQLRCDFDVTPRLRSINNVNALFFDKTSSLEVFTFQGKHRPVRRDRPEHRVRVPAAVEQQRDHPGRAGGAGARGAFRQLYNKKTARFRRCCPGSPKIVFTF